MNRSDFRTAVRTRVGNPSTDGFMSDANVNDAVDEAILAIGTEADWPWLQSVGSNITTASGTATYAIGDTGYTRTRGLTIDGYDPLEERQLAELRGMPTEDRGRPMYYAIAGTTLHLRPVPDGVYTIIHDIVTSETALTGDSDTPELPLAYHYAVVAKAAEILHLRQRDTARAQAERAEYNAWIARMRDNLYRTHAPKRIRVRPGSLY